jgi:hypothetical protein
LHFRHYRSSQQDAKAGVDVNKKVLTTDEEPRCPRHHCRRQDWRRAALGSNDEHQAFDDIGCHRGLALQRLGRFVVSAPLKSPAHPQGQGKRKTVAGKKKATK